MAKYRPYDTFSDKLQIRHLHEVGTERTLCGLMLIVPKATNGSKPTQTCRACARRLKERLA
jgi:hypothetical protein